MFLELAIFNMVMYPVEFYIHGLGPFDLIALIDESICGGVLSYLWSFQWAQFVPG
jgi:hypothetical protein